MEREAVVTNRKLGEGAFGMVYGGEALLGSEGQVQCAVSVCSVQCAVWSV